MKILMVLTSHDKLGNTETLACARMILGEVDRRRSGLELARHILDIPRVERA